MHSKEEYNKKRVDGVVEKVTNKLKLHKWDFLVPLFGTPLFRSSMMRLMDELDKGGTFYPNVSEWMSPFAWCKPEDVRVVMLTVPPQGTVEEKGLAFSIPLWSVWRDEMELRLREIYGNYELPKELSDWCMKGILVLRASFTVGMLRSDHFPIWKPVVSDLMDLLSKQYPRAIFVFMGPHAVQFTPFARGRSVIVEEFKELKTTNPFEIVNKMLLERGEEEILW